MAIGQIELNHAMTRIQDYTTQKHNEDQRGVVQQTHAQEKFSKELDRDIRQVIKTEQEEYQNKTQYQNKRFDSRDKGSNQYYSYHIAREYYDGYDFELLSTELKHNKLTKNLKVGYFDSKAQCDVITLDTIIYQKIKIQ